MKKKKKIKKGWKSDPTKVKHAPDTDAFGTITEKHYTSFGEHPEDRIFRDREYIQRIHRYVDSVYDLLANDLRLNEKGQEWLFDYVYNEDSNKIEFEEYLNKHNVEYCDLVKKYWDEMGDDFLVAQGMPKL
jgi:hypothetical protein